ncbi:MAG: HDOD domain-containing protein [Pseudomonadales bacterium]|nr:HDOD domain-containing protein [Pseudomonadales bacterium]
MSSPAPEIDNKLLRHLEKELRGRNFVLPSLPDSAQKVRDAINNPNVDSNQIAKIIGTDPVLSGRVIQAANSPLFRGLDRIEDLSNAVSRLGLTCVRNLVISLTVTKLYKGEGKKFLKDKMIFIWGLSIKVAAVSEVLAQNCRGIDPSEAMLAGLLHNIGAVPILAKCAQTNISDTYTDALDDALLKLEPTLGQWIMEQWQLREELSSVPINIADIYRSHEGPADYSDIIQVARLHAYRGTKHPLAKLKWIGIPAFEKLNLTPEESIEAIKEADADIKEVMQMLRS